MTTEVTEADLPHLRRCVELATEAVEAGDFPFGSVLVAENGTVLAEDRNRELTAGGPDAPPGVRAGAVGGDEHDPAGASRGDCLYLR
jgi:tRNA(Arg) A34 adenosine deaminase TadA